MAHCLNCSQACGIFPDQGLNLCLLHWQGNPSPLSHQGIPKQFLNEGERGISEQPRPEASADRALHSEPLWQSVCARLPSFDTASPFVSSFSSVRATKHLLCENQQREHRRRPGPLHCVTGASQDTPRAKGNASGENYGAARDGVCLPHSFPPFTPLARS